MLHKWKGDAMNGNFLLLINSASPQFSVVVNGHASDSGTFIRKHETISSCLMVILTESCDLHSA